MSACCKLVRGFDSVKTDKVSQSRFLSRTEVGRNGTMVGSGLRRFGEYRL